MNCYQHYDIIDELKDFLSIKSLNVDINKIIHDLDYSENISGENTCINLDNRIYCNIIPKNLSTISLESILVSDINIAKKYVSNNKHNIIFMNYVKDKFRNLVNNCVTDFMFYIVYQCARNVASSYPYDYFIYGEYIRNCFCKEYIPCKTMEINISDGELYYDLSTFLKIYFYVQHNYSNIESFRDEGERVYCGREYYTLYPQIENKNFMKFLLSRSYIKNILQIFNESDWFILLETVNDIKIDLLVTTDDNHIKTNFNVNNLCLRIPSDLIKQKINLDDVLDTLAINAKSLFVKGLFNENYQIFDHGICIIPLKKISIENIFDNILDKKFIINNNEANTMEHKCISIYVKKGKNIWKKRSRHSRILMENYQFMINNGWSCFNQKCDNIDCVLYYI
ncbi:hypothetical protein [Powai lake megavirus]|uniref:Uncharacterized protein n=1 Tax=Powai lake megavirus TaxID=1842663 RepID=A0A161HRH1_9VIRU|nr:hypothetical protein QJ849_gp905 [Powai lake megavirus]ANB51067.1 hypothetical protein [Powai lake megavirus]